MERDIDRIIFDSELIAERTAQIAAQINRDFAGEEIVLISILKGSVVFFSDILRRIELPCEIDFMAVSSYKNSAVPGELEIIKDISADIAGKNVIIVEDILDTGVTLGAVYDLLERRAPKTLKICVLLDKKVAKRREIKADYTGFETDDVFVVGYGLDHAQRYRNLPYIGALKEEIWKTKD